MYLASLCSKQSRLYIYILANLRGCCSAAAPPGFGTEIKKHTTINYFMLHYNMVHVQCLQFKVFSEGNRQCPKEYASTLGHPCTITTSAPWHRCRLQIILTVYLSSSQQKIHLTRPWFKRDLDGSHFLTWTGATLIPRRPNAYFVIASSTTCCVRFLIASH